MGYAALTLDELLACPFCREIFPKGERDVCPTCGLPLSPMSKLPPSYEAQLEDDLPEEPEWEPQRWWFAGRGRGVLVAAGLLGIGLFFAPGMKER